ncbi:hypothetical protein [Paracoccus onubensis]|uniref:Uncharacterized protein n=1 Tax=Paracoccus onubensis TaxID=1675788 RepID=A0A418T445_9RHOB|nr:hypothetical protein [Paracoccus onubensis]RJE87945.1 hypothetical protein D3P04_03215 [Paracoccus onubensis]
MRRSTPQKKIDDRAFPVRVIVELPEIGKHRPLDEMYQWLDQNIGRGDYAWHSGGRNPLLGECVALYFRHPKPAVDFLAAIPELKLSDGTIFPSYTSPYRS